MIPGQEEAKMHSGYIPVDASTRLPLVALPVLFGSSLCLRWIRTFALLHDFDGFNGAFANVPVASDAPDSGIPYMQTSIMRGHPKRMARCRAFQKWKVPRVQSSMWSSPDGWILGLTLDADSCMLITVSERIPTADLYSRAGDGPRSATSTGLVHTDY